MEGALFSLGETDLRSLVEKENGAEVHCEFCRQSYRFDKEDLLNLLNKSIH
jgi:molecular chaperone Hsp33